MSILRMASFKASYALFLKLVSGTIRTIAISASAMVGGALVCFRVGTTISPAGDVVITTISISFFGMPNARMSSYACFRRFHAASHLDNFVSGIPNAIKPICGRAAMPGHRTPACAMSGNPFEGAQAFIVLMPARIADELKIDAKEEANVEFQRCGPQDTRSGQGGQTHKPDGAGRQAGVRRLRHCGAEGGGGQVRGRSGQDRDRYGLPGRHEDRLARYPAQDRSRWRDGGSEDRRRRRKELRDHFGQRQAVPLR